MTQQKQAAEAKPSLIARVFGSRTAQALGVFGVAWTLFQGLEPFLRFSRFMAYLVDHWREYTREIWSWLASFLALDIPLVLSDVLTSIMFLALFTIRSLRYRNYQVQRKSNTFVAGYLLRWLGALEDNRKLSRFWRWIASIITMLLVLLFISLYTDLINVVVVYLAMIVVIALSLTALPGLFVQTLTILIVPLAIFSSLYMHVGLLYALSVALSLMLVYRTGVGMLNGDPVDAIAASSERVIIVLVALLALNYIALHSHAIEAWLREATK